MKKYGIKPIPAFLALICMILLAGIAGGIELDTMTISEGLKRTAILAPALFFFGWRATSNMK